MRKNIINVDEKYPMEAKKFYGVAWTLEDFALREDVTLKNGTVLPAGKRFFTWQEAMTLQHMHAFPEGCRLPTASELQNLVKNVGALTIERRLKFDTYYGFLDYYYSGQPCISDEGKYGYYWSSSSGAKDNAVVLEVERTKMGRNYYYVRVCVRTSYRDYGNSIRLVYDPNFFSKATHS